MISLLALLSLAACGRVARPDGASGSVVAGKRLIIGTMEGDLVALDTDSGATLWKLELRSGENVKNTAIYGTPAVDGDTVYIGGYNGRLYAVSLTGEERWVEPVGIDEARIVGSPVVAGGLVLIGSSDGNLYAFDTNPEEHSRVWEFPTGGEVWATPVVSDGVVYFGSLDHKFYAVDLGNGEKVWEFRTKGGITARAVVAGGRVYVGSFDHVLYAIDVKTGKEVARFGGATGWYWAGAVATEDTLYVPSLDGRLYALGLDDLKPRWPPFVTDEAITNTPVIIRDRIAVPSNDGRVRLVRLRDGGDQRQCNIGKKIKSLATDQGTIYVAANDHSVRALRVDSRADMDEVWARRTDRDEPELPSRSKPC